MNDPILISSELKRSRSGPAIKLNTHSKDALLIVSGVGCYINLHFAADEVKGLVAMLTESAKRMETEEVAA